MNTSDPIAVSPIRSGFEGRLPERAKAEHEADLRTAASEAPAPVQTKVGAWIEVLLPSLAGAGYLWKVDIAGDEGAVSTPARLRTDVPTSLAVADNAPVGGAGVERWEFQAQTPGRVTLVFSQARPWEKEAPLDTRCLSIVVS